MGRDDFVRGFFAGDFLGADAYRVGRGGGAVGLSVDDFIE